MRFLFEPTGYLLPRLCFSSSLFSWLVYPWDLSRSAGNKQVIYYSRYKSVFMLPNEVKVLPDLRRGQLVMLTALEALVNGCHGVGCLLPEVQKCRLQKSKEASK